MAADFEILKAMSAIYRCAFFNQTIHKNTMKNQLIFRGKVSSKNRFFQAFDRLVATGGLIKDKEYVSINPDIVKTGFLQQEGDEFYVVMAETNEHFRISKSVAASYKNGDPLHIIIQDIGGQREAIVLGKNYDGDFAAYTKKKIKEEEEKLEKGNLVLGRVVKLSHDDLVFIPNNRSLPVRHVPILNNREEHARFQDKICVMKFADNEDISLGGFIVDVKGDAGNPIHEYDAIAESSGAVMGWDGEKYKREIDKFPRKVDVDSLSLISEADAVKGQAGKVVDLRHINFFTVDPADCRDMDDAIYSTFDEKGDIVCYTAVANVTEYVPLKSEVGKLALQAGFTRYAPNKAYSLYPSEISTGICSINPMQPRRTIVIKTLIDKRTGRVKKSRIYDALIQSHGKFAYETAQGFVDEGLDEITRGYLMARCNSGEQLTDREQTLMNYYAAQTMKKAFDSRGMIRFVANKDRKYVFNEDMSDITDITLINPVDYCKVIEFFMLTANEQVAKFAIDNNIDIVFRVHDEPNMQKVERAQEFFSVLGIDFDGDLTAEGISALLEKCKGTPYEEMVNTFLIKMQSRAVYSDHPYPYADEEEEEKGGKKPEQISHYALQSKHYCHATANIRRLPDYPTLYNIQAFLHGTKPISKGEIRDIVDQSNRCQLATDQAERDFEDTSSAIYASNHIGAKLHGHITKFRLATPEDACEDDIIVVVKDQATGIHAEIPLSQVTGKPAGSYALSRYGSYVYDIHGSNVVLLCKPIDFYIESADRRSMQIIGRTDKVVSKRKDRSSVTSGRQLLTREQIVEPGVYHERAKRSKAERIKNNKSHDRRHTNSKYYDDEGKW